MADKSEVVFSTIRDKVKLVQNGNDNSILALAVAGATQSKFLAPVQEGQLRNGIQWVVYNGQKGGLNDSAGKKAETELVVSLKKGEAAVGGTTGHDPYVEFGTKYMAPQPHHRPSLALVAGQAPKVVKEKMDEEFKKGPLKYGQSRVKF